MPYCHCEYGKPNMRHASRRAQWMAGPSECTCHITISSYIFQHFSGVPPRTLGPSLNGLWQSAPFFPRKTAVCPLTIFLCISEVSYDRICGWAIWVVLLRHLSPLTRGRWTVVPCSSYMVPLTRGISNISCGGINSLYCAIFTRLFMSRCFSLRSATTPT